MLELMDANFQVDSFKLHMDLLYMNQFVVLIGDCMKHILWYRKLLVVIVNLLYRIYKLANFPIFKHLPLHLLFRRLLHPTHSSPPLGKPLVWNGTLGCRLNANPDHAISKILSTFQNWSQMRWNSAYNVKTNLNMIRCPQYMRRLITNKQHSIAMTQRL